MAKAIIYYEKVWYEGKPMIKILGWKNVKKLSQLPKEYLKTRDIPIFCETADDYIGLPGNQKYGFITKGTLLGADDFQIIISIMKQAGERLHNILKKKKWSGKGEIEI